MKRAIFLGTTKEDRIRLAPATWKRGFIPVKVLPDGPLESDDIVIVRTDRNGPFRGPGAIAELRERIGSEPTLVVMTPDGRLRVVSSSRPTNPFAKHVRRGRLKPTA